MMAVIYFCLRRLARNEREARTSKLLRSGNWLAIYGCRPQKTPRPRLTLRLQSIAWQGKSAGRGGKPQWKSRDAGFTRGLARSRAPKWDQGSRCSNRFVIESFHSKKAPEAGHVAGLSVSISSVDETSSLLCSSKPW